MIGPPLSSSRVAEWGHAFRELGAYGAIQRVRAAVGCVGAIALPINIVLVNVLSWGKP